MARVPVAAPGVAPVAAPQQYQRIATTEADFGGLQARALVQGGQQLTAAGDLLGKRALEMQIEDNEREAKKLDVELSKQLRLITYGDGSENRGYYEKRGEDAVTGYKDTETAIAEARRKVMETAKNDRVRELFAPVSAARVEREVEGLSRHMAQQRRVAADTVSEARLNEAADDAGANWNNPTILAQSLGIARSEVQDMAVRNGWSPEVTASKLQEAQTVLHKSVINAAMQQDPAAAKAYFDKWKGSIDGRVHADIEKALEAGTLRQQSQAEAARIMGAFKDEAAALVEARAIKDPKVQDEVVTRVKAQFAERYAAEQRAEKETRKAAWQVIMGGGTTDKLTPQQLAALDGTTISSMQAFVDRRVKDGRGFPKVTEPAAYNELHKLFMDDKVAFANTDLTKYMGRLDERDMEYWMGQQRAIDRKGEQDAARQENYTLADRLATEYMQAAKWDIGEKGKDSAKAVEVRRLVRGIVEDAHKAGKRATREDLERGLSEMFLSGEADGSGWFVDDTGRRVQFMGTANDSKFIITNAKDQVPMIARATGVPNDQVMNVVAALKKEGVPVTAANIKATYERATRGSK